LIFLNHINGATVSTNSLTDIAKLYNVFKLL
jgi:hypothetical protein